MNQKTKKVLKENRGNYPLVMRIIAVAYGLFTMLGAWPNGLSYYYKGHEIGLWGKWAMFAFGLLIFWCGIFYKRPMGGKHFTKLEESICPKCQQVFMPKKAPEDQMCHKCNCPLEQLEGFYDRHPELKEAEIDTSSEETKE